MSAALQGQLLELEQGSDAWLSARAKRIGASEVAACFQESPYFTERELYLFKEGYVPEWFVQDPDNYIFKKGHEFEEKMRAEWFALTGKNFKPTVRVNKKYPHLIASLDGEFEKDIFEAKLVGAEVLADIIEFNRPPRHHWIQIQQQLLITNANKCVYFAHTLDGEGVVVDVFPDKEFQKELLIKTIAFQRKRKNKEEPAMSKDDFHFAPDSPVFDELRELNEKKTAAKKAYEQIEQDYKAKLKEVHSPFGHSNVANISARVKIKKMSRATIKWFSIPEVIALSEEYINKFKTTGEPYVQAWFSKKDAK
jgi:putative phage-type endonuclease